MTQTLAPPPAEAPQGAVGQEAQQPGGGTRASMTLLVFRLSGQAFAVPIEHVSEILDPILPTPVPNAPAEAPALINVRGTIAPLIAIRHRLRMPSATAESARRLIVVDVDREDGRQRYVIEADVVESVVDLPSNRIEPVPPLGAAWPVELITGAARRDDGLLIVLNIVALTQAGATHDGAGQPGDPDAETPPETP